MTSSAFLTCILLVAVSVAVGYQHGRNQHKVVNAECFPIALENDEYFTDRTCMTFSRSARTADSAGAQQQTNAITSFIDASNVYGSSQEELDRLRGDNGLLNNILIERKGRYLPAGDIGSCMADTGKYCFLAGDERVNEQPSLAAMHTISMREHNRIANELRRLNDNWNSNRIFQETRKIVGAMMQVITYNEFLPAVLGPGEYRKYNLTSDTYKYQANANPNIINAFATAAYRFGHSLIPESLLVGGGELFLRDAFLSPTAVLDSMDPLAKGVCEARAPQADRFFSQSVTRHLFQQGEGTGFDLVALNIQRGRDHGLPPFNNFRRDCRLTPLTRLDQLFPSDAAAQSAYANIDDVDLFTGGMSEPTVPGGLVGPTFACILGQQFRDLKTGDRFFYLNREGRQAFDSAQIRELNTVKLSKVICQNTENNKLQENIFSPESATNPAKDCREIPSLNLDAWGSGGGGGGGGGGCGGGGGRGRGGGGGRRDGRPRRVPSTKQRKEKHIG